MKVRQMLLVAILAVVLCAAAGVLSPTKAAIASSVKTAGVVSPHGCAWVEMASAEILSYSRTKTLGTVQAFVYGSADKTCQSGSGAATRIKIITYNYTSTIYGAVYRDGNGVGGLCSNVAAYNSCNVGSVSYQYTHMSAEAYIGYGETDPNKSGYASLGF